MKEAKSSENDKIQRTVQSTEGYWTVKIRNNNDSNVKINEF